MECDNISTRNIVIIAIIAIVIIVAGLYASGMLTGGTAEGNITVVAGAGTMSAMNDLKAEFEENIQEPLLTYSMETVPKFSPY